MAFKLGSAVPVAIHNSHIMSMAISPELKIPELNCTPPPPPGLIPDRQHAAVYSMASCLTMVLIWGVGGVPFLWTCTHNIIDHPAVGVPPSRYAVGRCMPGQLSCLMQKSPKENIYMSSLRGLGVQKWQ